MKYGLLQLGDRESLPRQVRQLPRKKKLALPMHGVDQVYDSQFSYSTYVYLGVLPQEQSSLQYQLRVQVTRGGFLKHSLLILWSLLTTYQLGYFYRQNSVYWFENRIALSERQRKKQKIQPKKCQLLEYLKKVRTWYT